MNYNFSNKNQGFQAKEIREFIKIAKKVLGEKNIQTIVLFGSKSTGEGNEWSDYDFYVVTKKEFGWNEKLEIYKKLDFNVDIIFRTYSEVKEGINSFCSIDIYAIYFGKIVYGEKLDREKKEIERLIQRGEIILKPELGKGVIEYGTKA